LQLDQCVRAVRIDQFPSGLSVLSAKPLKALRVAHKILGQRQVVAEADQLATTQ
jgi:hypothetical protein